MLGEEKIYLSMLSLILVSGVSVTDDAKVTCPSFRFQEDKSQAKCVYPSEDGTINYVQPCPDGYVCTSQSSDSYTCEPESVPTGYPGNDCSAYYGDCVVFCGSACQEYPDTKECICTGTVGGCTEGQLCDVGRVCYAGNCIKLLLEGFACSNDYECQYEDFCYIQEGASSGFCTELFSLPNGTKLAKCTDELIGYECQSGYCKEETDEAGKTTYQCAEISKLDKPDDKCEYNTDCVGYTIDSKTQVYSTCSCGYANNGNAYCELLPGDESYAAYRELVMKWLELYGNSMCYTERRYSIDCVEIYGDDQLYNEMLYYYYKTKYWSKINNVDTEVQKVLTPEYVTAEEEYMQSECDAFVEKLDSQTFSQSTCVFYDSEEEKNYVRACTDSTTCTPPDTLPGNYTCKTEEVEKSYPGELCKADDDCQYGSCGTDQKCIGKSENEACSDTGECAPGYYCKSVCLPLLNSYDLCEEDLECGYGMFCFKYPHSPQFIKTDCRSYFSLNSGDLLVTSGSDLFTVGCASGFTRDTVDTINNRAFKYTVCSDPYSVEKIYEPCSANIDCVAYKSDDKTDYIFSDCSCGYSQTGNSYCELLPGNDAYSQYISYMKSWANSNLAKNCNSKRRFSLGCIKEYWDTENLFALEYYALKVQYWPKHHDLQLGVSKTLTSDYWDAKEEYELNLPIDCNLYMCKTSSIQFSDTTCAYLQDKTFYLEACADNHDCVAGTSSVANYTCQAESEGPYAYPGESCKKDADCFTNICSENKCSGISACSSDYDCSPGTYCNGVCTELISSTACTKDTQCEYGTFCHIDGKCTPYFSIESGSSVTECPSDDICHKCASGFALTKTYDATEEKTCTCTDVYTLTSESPHECTKSLDCIGLNSKNEVIYSECECGYSKTGQGYCQLLPGNDAYAMYLKYFKKWVDSKKEANCNTARRFAIECAEDYMKEEDYYHLAYYRYKALMWPKIQNFDKCTKEIFASEYWEAKEDLEDYEDDDGAHSVAPLMAAAIFALLIIF